MAKSNSTGRSVSGTITNLLKQPLAGLTVQAFDQDAGGENLLGKYTTKENGEYRIAYTDADLRPGNAESGEADIIVRVYQGEKLLAESKPLPDAKPDEPLVISIDFNPKEKATDEPLPLKPNVKERLKTLSSSLKDKKLAAGLKETFTKAGGNWDAVKADLTADERFPDEVIKELDYTHNLAEWSGDNEKFITVFKEDKDANSMRDIALNFNKEDFAKKVEEAVPESAEKDVFIKEKYATLFAKEPTAMLVNMVKDTSVPMLNDAVGANVAKVLENQPDFNIKTTSVYELIANKDTFKDIPESMHEEVKTKLVELQPIVAVAPTPEAVPVLYETKMNSAYKIAGMPKSTFFSVMADTGLDGDTLEMIHNNAETTYARNEHTLMALKEAGTGTGIAMIDNSMGFRKKEEGDLEVTMSAMVYDAPGVAREVLEKHHLSWDVLFGGADFCECGECTSVYSAASYFVELLQYLRNNNLDKYATGSTVIKSNPKDISGTPLEKLLDRRPDLGCLQLTCQNTNTILPYIDLVNEVMENYVAFKKLKPFNVDDETSGELLAEPQHTEYQAYCILKNEVYPFTLPYHQPIDAARIYYEGLGTSRAEVIDTFRKSNAGPDAALTVLKDEALDRAADAESLGITKEEYIILTKECFESRLLMDKLKNKVRTDAEYRQLIGVKPVHEYYGYDTEADMLGDSGLKLIKKEFLRRTGIDYFDLVELLKTRYINPRAPKGRSKVIMDSLRYSYRFLQLYAAIFGLDKMAEDLVKMEQFADLYPKLVELIETITGKKAPACPKTGEEKPEITDKDIIHWVKCNFTKVGKMIVIESGHSCINGEIRPRKKPEFKSPIHIYIEDCKVVRKYQGVTEELGAVDKETGKIIFKDPDVDVLSLLGCEFVGERGEKAVFILVGKELYLLITEQMDSCDLETATLQHLDGTSVTVDEYDRIHRFIRLWRKLGWTMDETDKAIEGLSIQSVAENGGSIPAASDSLCADTDDCGGSADGDCEDCSDCQDEDSSHLDINPTLIHQLVAVKKLLDLTGLELLRLLTFWTNISTAGEKSLYARLFLTHNLLGIDKVFKADANGNYLSGNEKMSDHMPVIMAAFNLSADDIEDIMAAASLDDKLTLAHLTVLYRYRLLAKALGLRIPAFIGILPLFGNVFGSAYTTLEFMQRWGRMEDAGFSHQQLNYIVKNKDDDKKPFAPTQIAVLKLAKTLYDGLNAIDDAHQNLKADADLTDPGKQKENILEKATGELVRQKASLLFDTAIVEKISGLLEGSYAYTTNAPANLDITVADGKSLKNKLKYNKTAGTIEITGILTTTEKTDYLALSSNTNWAPAIVRIEKQQKKLVKELLSGIFDEEKILTDAEKAALQQTIQAGDISMPFEQIPAGEEDPNTAPKKREAFLRIFLPYLRQQLTHRFIIDTLSAFAALDHKVTDVLVSSVLKSGTPAAPIYSIFEKIKESSKPADSNWSGYLIPATGATYTFIVKNTDLTPVVSIDGTAITFTQQEDPTNEWWSATLEMEAGKLYKLVTTGIDIKNVAWKTPSSAITAIPLSSLIPDFASSQCQPALVSLKKSAMLISGFNLSADETAFFDAHKTNFDGIDFNAITLAAWLRLEACVRLRNSLPEMKINLLDFWNWVYNAASDSSQISEKIAGLTSWKQERVQKLVAADHYNLLQLQDFYNEKNLLKLQHALEVADKIGVDINLLFDWALPTSKFSTCRKIADSIKNAMRARYNQTDWEQFIKPMHDQLRNNQKEALIAYLLQQPELIKWGVADADGLFEFFLIDVQMDACMETSRIKQAISSVQLFVQRCFLGLEEEYSDIVPSDLDRGRWDWMQRYRVWEANRKVFLYPENWIESNLRDDKSPFFKELEGELLQKDINRDNVTEALKSYLYKVDEVANMEVIGLYIDGTRTGKQWSKGAKMHVFSRTRNAPYFFYYRYLALDEMNWYPWEKMQIDIPSYDVQNSAGQVVANGCYLTPVAWNGRLLVFFPQIIKKVKPATVNSDSSFQQIGNTTSPNGNRPAEYYEIKMCQSELRNGKWTQKQMSTDLLRLDVIQPGAPADSRSIDKFSFIPHIHTDGSAISIYVEDQAGQPANTDIATFRGFTFSGSVFEPDSEMGTVVNSLPSSVYTEFGGSTRFQKVSNRIQSMQLNTDTFGNNVWGNDDAGFTIGANTVTFDFTNTSISGLSFYYGNSGRLMQKINLGELEEFFKANLDFDPKEFGAYDHDNDAATPDSYHELKRPYSLYNWELFFHTPMLLANALSKSQQFEEAMKWFHYVFNPIADGNDDKRFWQFRPFKEIDTKRVLDSIFNALEPNKSNDAITEWRNNPFKPHVVARSRPVAYMKWVVMKYIDNLVAWGDYLFRQDTIESINQATQLYILAGHILGPRPMMIPKRGTKKPETYLSLLDRWDAFGNAMVKLELAAPFSNQTYLPLGTVNGELAFANVFGFSTERYFCIPNNPTLMGYWDTIADRLYKIRHCQNIEGVFRMLPLFEPPIDPALLVKAAAQGLSVASVLNDLNTPLPNYRFYYLLQKALELCGELKSMGNALLSAFEKKDNETLALIRARHEGVMQNLVMEIKKKQLDEAMQNLAGLEQNRKAPEHRMKYYLKLIGEDAGRVPGLDAEFSEIANNIEDPVDESGLKLIKYEKEDMDKAKEAQDFNRAVGILETTASILHVIPSVSVDGKPFGVGMGSVVFAGTMLANALQAVGKGLQVHAGDLQFASTSAAKKGGFQRAMQDRIFQANAAGYEIKQIDKQILAQKIRIDIANLEINNQQKAIDNSQEVEDFLKNKYSNDELYTWMRGNLKTLYHQVYSLAYELAKKAEKVYCFERGLSSSNFIQPGYWDAGRDGLLSGEQLYVGLKQLEAAYQNERGYDYEITRHISLRQVAPLAVMKLRETGRCEFELPEALFDMDYPGHYKRRIKSVSISIPCVAGPYTGINASLRLLEHKYRNTAVGGKTYEEDTENTDARFSTHLIPISAIAASSAQNDGGVFELNFKDERYLPFEGAGLISKWRLDFPGVRQFDYHTISDVIIHIRYTSAEGGDKLKSAANKSLEKQLENIRQELNENGLQVVLNARHDLPNEWHLLKKNGEVKLTLDKGRIPYVIQSLGATGIEQVLFVSRSKNNPNTVQLEIDGAALDLQKINDEWKMCKGATEDIALDTEFTLTVPDAAQLSNLDELLVSIKYSF